MVRNQTRDLRLPERYNQTTIEKVGVSKRINDVIGVTLEKIGKIKEINGGEISVEEQDKIYDETRLSIIKILETIKGNENDLNPENYGYLARVLGLPQDFDFSIIIAGINGKLNSDGITDILKVLNLISKADCKTFIKRILILNINILLKKTEKLEEKQENHYSALDFLKSFKSPKPDFEQFDEIKEQFDKEGVDFLIELIIIDDEIYIENIVKFVLFLMERGYYDLLAKIFGTTATIIRTIDGYNKKIELSVEQKYNIIESIKILIGKYIAYKIFFKGHYIREIAAIRDQKARDSQKRKERTTPEQIENNIFKNFRGFLRINEVKNDKDIKYGFIDFRESPNVGLLRRKNKKFEAYVNLCKLLGFDESQRQIPKENDIFGIIARTKAYDGRKLIYELYFNGIKEVPLKYTLLIDCLFKNSLIKDLSELNSDSLESFQKKVGNGLNEYFNLDLIIKNSNNSNLEDILSEFMIKILKLPRQDVEGIITQLKDEKGKIDLSKFKKFGNCDAQKLISITTTVGISLSDIGSFPHLADFLEKFEIQEKSEKRGRKIEEKDRLNFDEIMKKLDLLIKLFPELKNERVSMINNPNFLSLLENIEKNILIFLLEEYNYEKSLRTIPRTIINDISTLMASKFQKHTEDTPSKQGTINRFLSICHAMMFDISLDGFIENNKNPFLIKGARVENFIMSAYSYVKYELSRNVRSPTERKIKITGNIDRLTSDFFEIGSNCNIILNGVSLEKMGENLGEIARMEIPIKHLYYFFLKHGMMDLPGKIKEALKN